LASPLVSEPAVESEPAKDLAKPFDSDAPKLIEAVKALLIPLALEPEREREPGMDLKNEYFSAAVRDRLSDPDSLVVQERGLELQINFPESTLAIMLPNVIVIEPASPLTNESFFARFDTRPMEPVRLLKNEFFSAKFATRPSVEERAFPHPFDWEPTNESEPLRP
jgi:hypothetical protein